MGANLVLDYVAIDAAMFTYFQGGSTKEMAQAVARTVPADADLVWASPWREGPDHCETLRQQLQ